MSPDDTAREALRLHQLATHNVGVADGGTMLVTPPPAEAIRLLKARETYTSRRIALLDPSPYMTPEECRANAELYAFAANHIATLAEAVLAGPRWCRAPDKTGCWVSSLGEYRFWSQMDVPMGEPRHGVTWYGPIPQPPAPADSAE